MKKWIPTADYIPGHDREVLVYDRDNEKLEICYFDRFSEYKTNEEKWINRNGECVIANYWRELPKEPQESYK